MRLAQTNSESEVSQTSMYKHISSQTSSADGLKLAVACNFRYNLLGIVGFWVSIGEQNCFPLVQRKNGEPESVFTLAFFCLLDMI